MPPEPDRSYELREDEELGAGLKRIAAGRAEKAIERLRDEDDRAEAIHGARKDMKKLRTVLRLVQSELPKDLYREEMRRYRDAGRALSASRDATVKLKTLDGLTEEGGELPREAIESWRQILDRDREAAANVGGDERAAIDLIEAGLASSRRWPLEGDSWKTIDGAVGRTYRRGLQAMRVAAGEASEEGFHRWRKRAKDLWYELVLLGPAWRGPMEAAAGEAHRLTELLGDHHDLALLREDLHERQLGEREAAALEGAIFKRQKDLAGEAFGLGRRLYAEKPKAFERRLRRYWEAWPEASTRQRCPDGDEL
ncbi:MAG: CHAD domain-containing protein [Solirubrobacterales bacterium]